MKTSLAKATKNLDAGFAVNLVVKCIDLPNGPWSRLSLVEDLGIGNFTAAMRLSRTLKKLNIRTASQLFRTDPCSLARIRGVGMAQLFVAMAILDHAGISVAEWWGWDGDRPVRTFTTYKHNLVYRTKKQGTVDA